MEEKSKAGTSYNAQQMTKKFLYEGEKEQEKIMKVLEKVKKKVHKIPQHPTIRLVDMDDPIKATSWHEHMEELAEIGDRIANNSYLRKRYYKIGRID